MMKVGGEVERGTTGCLVQSVQADYSKFLASATYLHVYALSAKKLLKCDLIGVIQHKFMITLYVSIRIIIWRAAPHRLHVLPSNRRSPPLTVICCSPPTIFLDEKRCSTWAVKRGCPRGQPLRQPHNLYLRTTTPHLHTIRPTPPSTQPPPLLNSFVCRSPHHSCTPLSSQPRNYGALGRRHAVGRLV